MIRLEKDIRQVVANNVTYLLAIKNMSVNQLVELSGVNSQSMQNMMKMKTKNGITIVSLQKIAMALEINPGDLVDDWQ
ncbi:helix-turn-helix transcriptional regulator [Loigolactobacillus backii]|nr:helix-turn-helix transcriptional regulator [Loigolactobacillus backii]